jgi:C4-dicarboxylate-specific signal transduction histidine kinase
MSAETDVNTYFRISTKQGKTKYIRSSGKKIIADDKLVGYLGLAWDVTSEVLMQKSLVAQSRMATLGEMAAGIAHEINNPLTIVQGKTLILLDKIEQKKFDFQSCRHDLLQIEQNCIRIDRIMKSFKSVSSKIDEEPFELSDLSTIIQQAIDIVKEKFSSKNVKISYKKESIPKDISVQVRPSEIIQVLLNLITNGFDAVENQKDGWVEVGINFSKGVYQVEILDSGSEIDLEVVRHMMEPFFTTKPSGQGTGLGLAIARQIVQNHRGELFYDAASLHTRFVFTLPASL